MLIFFEVLIFKLFMIKQLQDKIARLQTQKTTQQTEYIQKKQHYQSIIQELQNDNQKLRKYIEDNEPLSLVQSHAKSQKSSKISSPVHFYSKERQVPDDVKQNPMAYNDLLEQNQMLKEGVVQLTKTYEDQIQQMRNYFNKIQEVYNTLAQKVNRIDFINKEIPKEQINDLVRVYQNLLKDFESQRMKYVEKIQELTNYIIKFQEKEKSMEEEHQKLEIELKIVKQQLKIYKRSKIGK